MTAGVLIYNKGHKMVVRVAVCLHTLNKHYDGPVTVLADGADACEALAPICKRFGAQMVEPDFPRVLTGKNGILLNKCQLHLVTPYDVSLLIDADCTVHGDVTPMIEAAAKAEFSVAQFTDWEIKKKMLKRVMRWEGKVSDAMLSRAIAYPAAINTGVYGFTRDSLLMRDWFDIAAKGKEDIFIPDEGAAQVMLPSYHHKLMPPVFNVSCRYGKPEHFADARVTHWHGRKHCRFEDDNKTHKYNSYIWYKEFEEIRERREVKKWIRKDKQLRHYLPTWDAVKGNA